MKRTDEIQTKTKMEKTIKATKEITTKKTITEKDK